MKSPHVAYLSEVIYLKWNWPLSWLKPWRVQKRRKKVSKYGQKFLRKQKNCTELEIKCWEIICLKDASKGKKFIYEKPKPYHKEDKQIYRTEIGMARMGRKASNFYVHRTQIGICHQEQKYQRFERPCNSASVRCSVAPPWSSTRFQLTCWEG